MNPYPKPDPNLTMYPNYPVDVEQFLKNNHWQQSSAPGYWYNYTMNSDIEYTWPEALAICMFTNYRHIFLMADPK